ncbi:hypothetical protein SAY87_018467 [Trapa incisa]|uniref:Cyclin-dependent kinase inhibitor domain-containing protein n=1 Tax=Trapa incisa TaxID=236973 RepID=A0AAN7QW76_9MYRT|nr:hypothetical protein SAY87_018467 [Trapa incisa]
MMNLEAMKVRTRTRDSAVASSVGADEASTGLASKRRRRPDDVEESLKVSSNNSTCTQLKDSSGGQNSESLPIKVTESFLHPSTSSEDQASVSSCFSSYEAQPSDEEKDNFRFADLEPECRETDSSTSRLSIERRDSTPSSEVGVGEEADNLSSFLVKSSYSNPPQPSKNEAYSLVEVKIPSNFEIEEFFAAAEAQSLLNLELLKDKYNFDFLEEKPLDLEGRFEWHHVPLEGKVSESK